MTKLLDELLQSKFSNRKPAIWGCGHNAPKVSDILRRNGIKAWTWFDLAAPSNGGEFNGMPLLAPGYVNSEYYILVSSHYIEEIRKFLEERGLSEIDDWIYALEEDYYEALLQNKDAEIVPDLSQNDLNDLEIKIATVVETKKISININEFDVYEKELSFSEIYNSKHNIRYIRKIKEYFWVNKLLNFDSWDKEDIYVDMGSAGSPFVHYLRKKGIKAFAIDLDEKCADGKYYICGDATNTNFKSNSVRAVSLQSAFEMFPHDTDIRLIKEIGRILIPGGKAIILPLYMHTEYISSTSPNYYGKGFADKGSKECIRTDCWSGVPLGRLYNVNALKYRVIDIALSNGLRPKVYCLPNDEIEKDGFVYLKFIMELNK